ncbi:MAG: hypothetical protein CBB71_06925 [Rhodopirellula sp. TMED11]|nr:MAG: hypothetical protein CBB71_06925 [Rhodopirellula sp. TMED11]
MSLRMKINRICQLSVAALMAGAILAGSTGCQTVHNGQVLPSPDYLSDDIQYFPSGPEMKLSREAAALAAARAEEAKNR